MKEKGIRKESSRTAAGYVLSESIPVPDPRSPIPIFLLALILLLASCTFDYGDTEGSGSDLPDLVMQNVDYMRVRSADPLARFKAQRAERYESKGLMLLQNFTFEQYGERGEEVNAFGRAGNAEVKIDTSDVFMDNGVRIEVQSEDIIIETNQLDWKDEPRTLSSGEDEKVYIYQDNGTGFSGIGLYVDARWRKWEFKSAVAGTYIYEEKEVIEEAVPEEQTEEEQIE